MRYFEIVSGLRLPVNGEEQQLLDKIGTDLFPVDDLDERDAEVARLMVSKGLLHRNAINGKTVVSVNTAADAWRI